MVGSMRGAAESGRRSVRVLLAAVMVGVVLADSSIVMLALPDVLREFRAGVGDVAWVLISFNLVLAVTAVPAVWLVRRAGSVAAWRAGLVVFAAASLGCVLAPGLWLLVGARCVQALGGAVVVAAAFDQLIGDLGRERAATAWIGAGILGAAVGPAVGGALTELLSWQAIFAVQVPVVAFATVAARGLRRDREAAAGRPPGLILASLALVSAALTAALFLLVVMLIEGWRLPPIEAAGVVTIMPAAALLTRRLAGHLGGAGASAGAGAIALAGGLAALGLLPGADVAWVVAPEILIGYGLGASLATLAGRAFRGAAGLDVRAAWTITARHAGVVLGLALLTPVFTADLGAQDVAAQRAGSALLLDADLTPGVKVSLGGRIVGQVQHADGRLPDLVPAFAGFQSPPADRAAVARLRVKLVDEVRRAATQAFSRSFLVAGALALLALGPLLVAWRRGPT